MLKKFFNLIFNRNNTKEESPIIENNTDIENLKEENSQNIKEDTQDFLQKKKEVNDEITTIIETQNEEDLDLNQLIDNYHFLEFAAVGDIVNVRIEQMFDDEFLASTIDTRQEISIPFKLGKEGLEIGKELKVKIINDENGIFTGMPLMDETNPFNVNDVIKGFVKSYKEPFYTVIINKKSYLVKKDQMCCPPILDPYSFVGQTLDFKIENTEYTDKGLRIFLSRYDLTLKDREKKVADTEIGTVLTLEKFKKIYGGLESIIDNMRIFIPNKELCFGDYSDINKELKTPFEIEVVNKTHDTLICSRKKLLADPFKAFCEDYMDSKEPFEVTIKNIYNYGFLCEIEKYRINAFLAFNSIDDINKSIEVQKKELNDKIQVYLSKIKVDEKKIYVKVCEDET